MESTSEPLRRFGPAAFVFKAILVAIVADVLLLGYILLRRAYRKRYFAKHDARMLEIRGKWDALVSGEIPYDAWRTKSYDRRIVETIVLDRLEAAGSEEAARLMKFLRASGLIEKRIFDARNHRGWRRHRALVALGRTRAPEGIPALAEGLRDHDLETRLAALRGLGRTASPQAAEEILNWLSERGLNVPALPLQNALIQSCAERPRLLLPYLQHADGAVREVLARVLGEVATPSLGDDLLQFAADDLAELRAAAARALSQSDARLALDVLKELAGDAVWFVRLRAIVSLGKLRDKNAVPALLRGLTDANRLVRLRAGEALVELKTEMVEIFDQVVETNDRYALYAYLTALDNGDLQPQLELELQTSARLDSKHKQLLTDILHAGSFPAEHPGIQERASVKAGANHA